MWKRSSAHSDTKQGRKQHGRIHDIILFYTRSDEWTWNPVYTPYDPEYVEAFYKYVDPETGRRYRLGTSRDRVAPRREIRVTKSWASPATGAIRRRR